MSDLITPAPAPSRSAPRVAIGKAIALGLVAGFMSGMFGVGGGILLVPVLVIGLGVPQKLANGTSLAAVLPVALSSLTGYLTDGKVDWPVAGLLAVGAIGGAVIGTHVLHLLPHRVVGYAFALLLVATAVRLIIDHSSADGRSPLHLLGMVALVLVGVLSGILAGLLGVGGGIVMVPVMVVGFGIPAAIAKGTSLGVIVPTSVMGTWRNQRKRNVDLRLATALGLAGVVSAYAASQISVGMSESTSNVLFACLLSVVAERMVWQLVRERSAAQPAGQQGVDGPAGDGR